MWSAAWLTLGAVIGVVLPLEGNEPSLRLTFASMQLWAVWGAVSGLIYAACLALEQARFVHLLTYRRSLLWGALSGLVVPVGLLLGKAVVAPLPVPISFLALIVGFGVAGATCGVATLAFARRTDSTDAGDSPQKPRLSSPRALVATRAAFVGIGRRVRDAVRPWFMQTAQGGLEGRDLLGW